MIMRKKILLPIAVLFLFGAVSFVNAQTISANAISSAYFDFEDNLNGWTPGIETEGSDFYLSSEYAKTGISSACLVVISYAPVVI